MQALQIRGQLDAIAGHDRRVRLELGDKRAAPTVRNDVTSETSPSSTRPSRTSSVATGSPATSTCASIFDPSPSVNTTTRTPAARRIAARKVQVFRPDAERHRLS